MIDDDKIILSRFANRFEKCKTPEDLDKLCQTYLNFRGKDSGKDSNVVEQDKIVKSIYISAPRSGYRLFAATEKVDNRVFDNNMSNLSYAIQARLSNRLLIDIIQEKFIKITETIDNQHNQTIFRAELGAIKL